MQLEIITYIPINRSAGWAHSEVLSDGLELLTSVMVVTSALPLR